MKDRASTFLAVGCVWVVFGIASLALQHGITKNIIAPVFIIGGAGFIGTSMRLQGKRTKK
ncbi:MAG: hypothetical protein JWO47_1079 [Candidatus Saccharibacteria bacterium]|nr:hypothetical protein [Candidatus Saccharibacteria bacterium]